jgi:hypothetical protein
VKKLVVSIIATLHNHFSALLKVPAIKNLACVIDLSPFESWSERSIPKFALGIHQAIQVPR